MKNAVVTDCRPGGVEMNGNQGSCSWSGEFTVIASETGLSAQGSIVYRNCFPGVATCTANYDVSYTRANSGG